MTLTTLKAELLKEFDELIGIVPENALLQMSGGKEICVMCGHPTAADKVVKELRELMSHALDRAIREVLVGVLPLEVEDCGDHNGIGECCRNAARAEMIAGAKTNFGIDL